MFDSLKERNRLGPLLKVFNPEFVFSEADMTELEEKDHRSGLAEYHTDIVSDELLGKQSFSQMLHKLGTVPPVPIFCLLGIINYEIGRDVQESFYYVECS